MVKLNEPLVYLRAKTQDLSNIKKLNCWGCDLDDITLVKYMPHVEVLSLSVNGIRSLEPISFCKNLRELYIRQNSISDLSEIRHLQGLSKLRVLWLQENPCAEVPGYTDFVIDHLPQLEILDSMPIDRDLDGSRNASGRGYYRPDQVQSFHISPEKRAVSPFQTTQHNGAHDSSQHLRNSNMFMTSPPPRQFGAPHMMSSILGHSFSAEKSGESSGSTPRGHSPDLQRSCPNDPPHSNPRSRMHRSMTNDYHVQHSPAKSLSFTRSNSITIHPNDNNVLTAVTSLLNELDMEGLKFVISEAQNRLENF